MRDIDKICDNCTHWVEYESEVGIDDIVTGVCLYSITIPSNILQKESDLKPVTLNVLVTGPNASCSNYLASESFRRRCVA